MGTFLEFYLCPICAKIYRLQTNGENQSRYSLESLYIAIHNAHPQHSSFQTGDCPSTAVANSTSVSSHVTHGVSGRLFGAYVFPDAIFEDAESALVTSVDKTPWAPSQAGRCKQDYGPQVNFKKMRIKLNHYSGLPPFAEPLVRLIRQCGDQCPDLKFLTTFSPVELCCLDYRRSRASQIVPHLDDEWLWGEALVTLSLMSSSALTFELEYRPDDAFHRQLVALCPPTAVSAQDLQLVVAVPMPARSLTVTTGESRHTWRHSVRPEHVGERRLALTFRDLSAAFAPVALAASAGEAEAESGEGEGDAAIPIRDPDAAKRRALGAKLLEIARSYRGISVLESLAASSSSATESPDNAVEVELDSSNY